MKTVFLRALEEEDKAMAVLAAIRGDGEREQNERFEIDAASFTDLPGSPFTYWLSDRLRSAFTQFPAFESEGRAAKQGLATADDFRWVRTWWECAPEHSGPAFLVPFVKGGAYSPFYSDVHLGIRWGSDGRWIKDWKADQLARGLITANNSKCWNECSYFRPGLTWPSRPHKRGGFSFVGRGAIFSVSGMMLFERCEESLLATCALLNSNAYIGLLHAIMPRGSGGSGQTLKYEVGYLRMVPVPMPGTEIAAKLGALARRAWELGRTLDTSVETSHVFCLPALLQVHGDCLAARAGNWVKHVRSTNVELSEVQGNINRLAFSLYCIDGRDREVLEQALGEAAQQPFSDDDETIGLKDGGKKGDETATEVLATELMSWAVSVAFGRFDVRLATSTRESTAGASPFDPLPTCPPAALAGVDGLPSPTPPPGYPLALSEKAVLVDDPGHGSDLGAATRSVLDVVFGEHSDSWWNEVTEVLDPKGLDLRNWLRSSFFEYHLKLYSKSRRKAPIYWQLAIPSAQYSIWLYAHRLTRDSVFQIQNDVVAPKLAHEERKLASLVQGAGGSPSAKERKEIAAQESFVEELRAMLEEVKGVAPLWNPNLDDGVVLTMAPLWRLVPQHKAWQKELRLRWDELCTGKYDWAHVAMHLWPERVVPQCAKDRSLAIAHGLEDVFWVEGDDGKWTARSEPTQPVDELVKERTSSAVKAALASLLEAPVPARRGRGRRRTEAHA